jgi:hypothetical protein
MFLIKVIRDKIQEVVVLVFLFPECAHVITHR